MAFRHSRSAPPLTRARSYAGDIVLLCNYYTSTCDQVRIGFSESKQFITRDSDRAMDFFVEDGPLLAEIDDMTNGQWTAPYSKQRGGFRYLTLSLDTTGTVEFINLTVSRNSFNLKPQQLTYFFRCITP
jgi:hypothetical protein